MLHVFHIFYSFRYIILRSCSVGIAISSDKLTTACSLFFSSLGEGGFVSCFLVLYEI
jgi:hypothetical protein